TLYKWQVTSQKVSDNTYQLMFKTAGSPGWDLYGANEILADVPATELAFTDSSIRFTKPFEETGSPVTLKSVLFDNAAFKVYRGDVTFKTTITFKGKVPETLIGTFSYTYGKGDELYPLTPFSFSVTMEGGQKSETRTLI